MFLASSSSAAAARGRESERGAEYRLEARRGRLPRPLAPSSAPPPRARNASMLRGGEGGSCLLSSPFPLERAFTALPRASAVSYPSLAAACHAPGMRRAAVRVGVCVRLSRRTPSPGTLVSSAHRGLGLDRGRVLNPISRVFHDLLAAPSEIDSWESVRKQTGHACTDLPAWGASAPLFLAGSWSLTMVAPQRQLMSG